MFFQLIFVSIRVWLVISNCCARGLPHWQPTKSINLRKNLSHDQWLLPLFDYATPKTVSITKCLLKQPKLEKEIYYWSISPYGRFWSCMCRVDLVRVALYTHYGVAAALFIYRFGVRKTGCVEEPLWRRRHLDQKDGLTLRYKKSDVRAF